jgi:hypothetical protein
VGIHDTYTASDGTTQPTPRGGITQGPPPGIAGDATVSLNSKGYGNGDNSTLAGHPDVPVTNNIVAAHEVMGHAAEILKGGNPTEKNAIKIENEIRTQPNVNLKARPEPQ